MTVASRRLCPDIQHSWPPWFELVLPALIPDRLRHGGLPRAANAERCRHTSVGPGNRDSARSPGERYRRRCGVRRSPNGDDFPAPHRHPSPSPSSGSLVNAQRSHGPQRSRSRSAPQCGSAARHHHRQGTLTVRGQVGRIRRLIKRQHHLHRPPTNISVQGPAGQAPGAGS